MITPEQYSILMSIGTKRVTKAEILNEVLGRYRFWLKDASMVTKNIDILEKSFLIGKVSNQYILTNSGKDSVIEFEMMVNVVHNNNPTIEVDVKI